MVQAAEEACDSQHLAVEDRVCTVMTETFDQIDSTCIVTPQGEAMLPLWPPPCCSHGLCWGEQPCMLLCRSIWQTCAAGVGEACAASGTLLLVDSVCTLGGAPLFCDAWGVDCTCALQLQIVNPSGYPREPHFTRIRLRSCVDSLVVSEPHWVCTPACPACCIVSTKVCT